MMLAVVTQLAFIDGIAFNPFFRGLLSVLVAVVVLIGGTYLIVATNTGTRSGFMISLAGLFGWMFLMGLVWTIYGIGWHGASPTWSLVEINVDDLDDTDDGLLFSEVEDIQTLVAGTDALPLNGGLGVIGVDRDTVTARAANPDVARDALANATVVGEVADPDVAQEAALVASRGLSIGEWRYLVSSDATRGEAQASADTFLVERGIFAVGAYVPEQFGAFIRDGKPILQENPNLLERTWHTISETVFHPFFRTEYIVVQVRGTIDQPILPGQAPPVATADPNSSLVSVIMERDRGGPIPSLFSGRRFTPAMFTVFTGLLFALLAWNLHTRDQREAKIRANAGN